MSRRGVGAALIALAFAVGCGDTAPAPTTGAAEAGDRAERAAAATDEEHAAAHATIQTLAAAANDDDPNGCRGAFTPASATEFEKLWARTGVPSDEGWRALCRGHRAASWPADGVLTRRGELLWLHGTGPGRGAVAVPFRHIDGSWLIDLTSHGDIAAPGDVAGRLDGT